MHRVRTVFSTGARTKVPNVENAYDTTRVDVKFEHLNEIADRGDPNERF